MVDIKNEAERLRIGVRGGWIPIAQAVAWADQQIERAAEPHPALIEVAMSGDRGREEVAELLSLVPGSSDSVAIMRSCLNDLLEIVEREPVFGADAARWLEAAADRGELPESAFGSEAFALADEFALAEQGICGTVAEATDRLVAFLRGHARREA